MDKAILNNRLRKLIAKYDVERIVPECLNWSCEDVADWIEKLGFPLYKECFLLNVINGRRLILLDIQTLPKIGIVDFEHMKVITSAIRRLLGLEEPYWDRCIMLFRREPLALWLEQKQFTGEKYEDLTIHEFFLQNPDLFHEWLLLYEPKLKDD